MLPRLRLLLATALLVLSTFAAAAAGEPPLIAFGDPFPELALALTAPRPFDPKVDAVTSATISSAIIFDSIAQGQALLEELRNKGK